MGRKLQAVVALFPGNVPAPRAAIALPQQADRIIETVWKLDQLPDIAQLIDLMAFKGAA